jgi:hypothetical protein
MRQFSPAVETTPTASASVVMHPATEAAHLRVVIEKQPSCLLRVGVDGLLLAVNDAALNLLGATELAQVLNHNFAERFGLADGWWPEFAGRVASAGAASGECELRDLSGAERAVVLQGRALLDQPDGIDSLLVAVRDISATRRLEASLQAHEAERVKLQRALEEQQLALMERERAARTALAALRSEIDRGSVDQLRQLQTSLETAQAEVRQLQAALDQAKGERVLLQGAVGESDLARRQSRKALEEAEQRATRLETMATEAEAGRRQLQVLLDQTVAEHEEFEAALREREAKQQRLVAEQVSARMAAERALADARAQVEQLQKALSTVLDVASAARPTRREGRE